MDLLCCHMTLATNASFYNNLMALYLELQMPKLDKTMMEPLLLQKTQFMN